MSMFDPDTFLNTSTTEAGSTRIPPVPVDDYPAVIGAEEKDVVPRQFTSNSGDTYTVIDIFWYIDNPQLAEQLGRKTLRVKQTVFLDLTPSGGLDMAEGKNVQLNRVRDALGQNVAGQPWNPGMLRGAGPALIKISHRMDGEDTYDEVKSVAKLS